jgi:hypothetical protein
MIERDNCKLNHAKRNVKTMFNKKNKIAAVRLFIMNRSFSLDKPMSPIKGNKIMRKVMSVKTISSRTNM